MARRCKGTYVAASAVLRGKIIETYCRAGIQIQRRLRRESAVRVNASGFGSRPADLAFGDLAQRDDDIAVVRFDERFGAFEKLSGSFRGELNQDKTTGNFF